MILQPRPQLLGAHPVDASGTGVTLDTSERLGEILPGQEPPPETRRSGVRCGVTRRRMIAALWTGLLGLHPQSTPPRPPKGLAAVKATITSTHVLRLDFAFGPFPATNNPAGTMTSADFSTASTSLSTSTVPHPAIT